MNREHYESPQLEVWQVLTEQGFASSPFDDPAYTDFDLEWSKQDDEFA